MGDCRYSSTHSLPRHRWRCAGKDWS